MRSTSGFVAGIVWCGLAVAGAACAAQACADEGGADAAPPAADQEKLRPLPPAPLLLEQVLRGVLEAAPGRETLDEAMRRAAVRHRAAAAAAEAAQRRQFLKQQVQQFEQMLQPLVNVELAFARRACGNLPSEARREVLASSRRAVHEVAERVARLQFEGQGDGEPIDVRREIHQRVAAALEPRAAADEFAVYEREWRLRQERRADAARIRIVAKVDDQLGLTATQRRDVLVDLQDHWRPAWVRELDDHDGVMINDLPPAPDFADASIAPHLDPLQLRQWKKWREAANWDSVPRGSVDWSEINLLQQVQTAPDIWWRQ